MENKLRKFVTNDAQTYASYFLNINVIPGWLQPPTGGSKPDRRR